MKNINKKLLKTISDERFFEIKDGKFYFGVDPTGKLHLGHLIPIKLALTLLEKGLEGIILVGGFSGQIGDPTEKKESRIKLNIEVTEQFSSELFTTLNKIFINYSDKITFVNNKTWLEKLSFKEYLDLSYHISIARKTHLETFDNRLKNQMPLSAAEFMYPDIQMIDFLYLNRNYNCNIQIGGSDQWGNISYGVHYVGKITKKDNIYGLATPLLTENGKKIGKSEGNSVYVEDFFGIFQNSLQISKEVLFSMLEIFLPKIDLNLEELFLREALAKELLLLIDPKNGDRNFDEAKEKTEILFKADLETLSEIHFNKIGCNKVIQIINTLDDSKSKSEIKRKLAEGAISINGVKVYEDQELNFGKYRIKIGKQQVFLVCII